MRRKGQDSWRCNGRTPATSSAIAAWSSPGLTPATSPSWPMSCCVRLIEPGAHGDSLLTVRELSPVPGDGSALAHRRLAAGPSVVTAAFLASGVVHLVRPEVFEPIVPRPLPYKRELVYVSGLA